MASNEQNDEERSQALEHYNEIIQTLPKGNGWWFDHLYQSQGFWLPSLAIKALIFIQHNLFKFKDDDIILATYPKCGTTWLRALIFAIFKRTSFDFATHPLLNASPRDFVPFLEGYICNNKQHQNDHHQSRLLATHLPYTLFPRSSPTCRFVYICRDPKDVLVSKWHFAQKLRPKELPALSFQEAFESFCEGLSHYGPYWDHVLSYWKASLEAPEKVLFLTYEDMKREPFVQVKRLAEFLGTPFSVEEENQGLVEQILRLCSFENLSNLEVNKSTSSSSKFPISNSDFFRKGDVGDWKNYLKPEMAARLDHITKEKLRGSGLNFLQINIII